MKNERVRSIWLVLWLFTLSLDCFAEMPARKILSATGVKGGLVVHLGCGDGRLTAALGANDSYLVHGLDEDAGNVKRARDYIGIEGLYGKVTVEQWLGKELPYNDNVVNLLVAEDLYGVSIDEVMRVLCPNGVAYLKDGEKWKSKVKPWPGDIDEWTHFLHDADNNAVAKDTRIATPNHLQWQAGPKRTRDHDAQASISAMTSSKGRIFYIVDEGLTSLLHHPARWKLIARDAFNGKLLWKREIGSWITHLHYFRSGPAQLPRRLVSIGESVFVTLGFDAPVAALDAATGKTIRTYKGSKNAEEFIYLDGILLIVVGEPEIWNRHAPVIDNYWDFYDEEGPQPSKRIVAYNADTGKQLWKIEGGNLARLAPLSLTAGDNKAFYLDNEKLHCVDLQSGKELWDAPFATRGLFLRNYAPTVVQYKDTIACLSLDRLAVFSIKNGSKLWETKGYAGFASPGDLFIMNDTVWTFPGTQAIHVKPEDVPGKGKEFLAFDLYTGAIKKSLVKSEVWPSGHHHRCYRNKATERYLISSRRGLEFVDLEGDDNIINWWVRGVCQYGVMPCNGLIYAPPHPCQCFNEIKFDGFHALGAKEVKSETSSARRLVKGGAYGTTTLSAKDAPVNSAGAESRGLIWAPPVVNADPEEWPTYRHDITRSGCASTKVPVDIKKKWKADIGGKLSSVVVAENRLFVSAVDCQTVYCLDATNGKQLWKFIAEGRVDSPPTIYGGMVFFGCRNGHVYALRCSDGELAWRFRGSPIDRRTVVRDRLGSLWPIHGSVLVVNGTVYFCAGYSSYLDGGLRLHGVDAGSGEVQYSRTLRSEGANRDGAMPDVLVSDGRNITMRFRRYDLSLEESKGPKTATIVANTGLLEDCWGHRWNWTLGASDTFGKLLVFDDKAAYGVQTYYTFLKYDKSMQPGTHTGHLHQKYARYTPEQFPIGTRLFGRRNQKQKGSTQDKKKPRRTLSGNSHEWNRKTLIQFRSMVLADDVLFCGGWKDSVRISDNNARSEADSVLMVISTADGGTVKEYQLKAEPVFDGMAAAYGRLYLSLKDGSVTCLGGK
ncbi:MAG: PQQ-binding-like beta-propeller repeat protein [Phycisphaerae bacterium]|nr:PQQ-binding-like beta-propeller repeat protein [Phycisphaerae bacterium]